MQKAKYVYDHYQVNCFAEDTGLEINALNGEPGVYTAMYAGDARDAQANMNLALKNLEGKSDRSAHFKTVIALIIDGEVRLFEGIAKGQIIHHQKGDKGFGYDPIFQPDGYQITFAEMDDDEKNTISHRGKAVNKLVEFLNSQS